MALPENLRTNANFPFPALVVGNAPIAISKSGGIWEIDFSTAGLVTLQEQADLTNWDAIVYNPVLQTWAIVPVAGMNEGEIVFSIDARGTTISNAIIFDLPILFSCVIVGWALVADQVGSISIDIRKGPLSSFPPVTSIVAASPPALSGAIDAADTVLAGWTTQVTANDVLRFVTGSVATITRMTLSVKIRKSP